MKPTSDYFGKTIERDFLYLSFSFFDFSKESLEKLCLQFYGYLNSLFKSETIMLWTINAHSVRNEETIMNALSSCGGECILELTGDVKNELVYNKTSLKEYHRKLLYGSYLNLNDRKALNHWSGPNNVSVDYPDYYRNMIEPVLGDRERLKTALIKLLSCNKRNKSSLASHDIQASIDSSENPLSGGICGSMMIKISTLCLTGGVETMAGSLYEFGRKACEMYESLNGVVFVGYLPNDLDTFDQNINLSENLLNELQYEIENFESSLLYTAKYKYLPNVGWANFVSPLTVTLLDELATSDRVDVAGLLNGGLCIKSKKDISSVTIDDLKQIRKLLYNILLPGTSFLPINSFVRSHWQTMAVLDGEIDINDEQIVFRHEGDLNLDYVFPKYQEFKRIYQIISQWDPDNKKEKSLRKTGKKDDEFHRGIDEPDYYYSISLRVLSEYHNHKQENLHELLTIVINDAYRSMYSRNIGKKKKKDIPDVVNEIVLICQSFEQV